MDQGHAKVAEEHRDGAIGFLEISSGARDHYDQKTSKAIRE
jgi:hypothetical protein